MATANHDGKGRGVAALADRSLMLRGTAVDPAAEPPLVVDLDGTLVATDVLLEGSLQLLKRNPLALVRLLGCLRHGKAALKAGVAAATNLDVAHLPYRAEVLAYLESARSQGRRIVLATAADVGVARQVADRLGLFDAVLASDGKLNLSGERKRCRLVAEFGEKGYEYLGNAASDVSVWRSACRAVVVDAKPRLQRKVAAVTELADVLATTGPSAKDFVAAIRLNHWLNNLLVFAPLAAAHKVTDVAAVGHAALAFLAFGLCASGVYLMNDLLDLDADRHHPHKRERPIASGRIPLRTALAALPALLIGGFGLSVLLPGHFIALTATYVAMNVAYSARLKVVPILDVLLLAAFYTLRIVAGAVATEVWLSTWLLALAMFLFLSLALVKRYAELMVMRTVEGARARARGYRLEDAELLAALGGSAGYLAVLVLALYINSDAGRAQYAHPQVLWATCVLLLYWVSHLWLMAHRRRMEDDPLVFAVSDRASRVLVALMALTVVIAI